MNSKITCWCLLSFFFVGFHGAAVAQLTDKELHKKEVQAEKAFGFEYYEEAINYFGELLEINPESAKYNYYLGVSHMRSTHHEYALPYLKKAYELGYRSEGKPFIVLDESHDEYESEDMEFNLARAYHLHEEFEEAKKHYNALKKKYDEVYHNKIHDHEKEVIERYIEQCNNGIELLKSPVDVKINLLEGKVNTEYEEIVPLVTADQTVLIYTSRNPKTTGGQTDEDGRYMEDIYISYKDDASGKWGEPQGISDNINTEEHDACVGLSPDGHTLFTYRNNHHGTGDLYQSTLDGETWSKPEKLPEGINTKYLENSASISSDGKVLFFTSNRPGGVGGEDIYLSRKKSDGTWGKPSNLGVKLNTPYDDDAPFIHPDGKTLYFSSKGHNSMGGFDVFKAKYDETTGTWGDVENLGHPINTPENDIFFVFSANGERAYYSSHRENENVGGEDLYVMDFKQEVSLIHLYGLVLTDDGKPTEGVITVTDNETGEKVGEFTSNKSTGKYTVILPPGKNYGVSIEAPNSLPFSENIDLPDIGEYYEKKVDFKLNSLVSSKPTVTVLKNVFFDTDKAVLRKESFTELNKYFEILNNNKNLQVEIAGHTDTDGADSYNLKLSQKRAQAVVDYFKEKGIDGDRLFAVGYGEAYPVASNANEEGKQQNRRTELIVHDTKSEGADWKKSKGHYNNLSK